MVCLLPISAPRTVGWALLLCAAVAAMWWAQWRSPAGWVATGSQEPVLRSQAVVVLDADTGQLLVGRGAHRPLPPGPLAQMVTGLVIADTLDLSESVLVSRRAAAQAGLRVGLQVGEELPAAALFEALWLAGAVDATYALVEHVAGSESAFARLMHQWARETGALQARFESPLGLDRPDQAATAYDLALVARAVWAHPVLGPLSMQRRAEIDERRTVIRLHSFAWRYPDAMGIKSGYSADGGYVAAAAARRSGRTFVAVVLGSPSAEDRTSDLRAFLDFAARNDEALRERPAVDALPHDVQAGDTLSSIAARTGVSADAIREWNGIADPNRMQVGTRLWIPVQTE